MSVEDRLRAARSTMDQAAREQDEQRGLRDRRVAEAREDARAGMQRELGAAQKYAEHMEELNKRAKSAGGWATEKTMADRDQGSLMAFGGDDEETPEQTFPAYSAPSAAVPRPEPTPPPAAPPAAEPRRGRHARPIEDDDDFESTSWLV